MSLSYTWVGWNAAKRRYDTVLAVAVLAFMVVFVFVGRLAFRDEEAISVPTLAIRAMGCCAILMLHVAIWIGPLVRLFPSLGPLLYNRRHLGVATFVLALGHGALATLWYHGFGNVNPLQSLLGTNTSWLTVSHFPFELLGLAALIGLFILAATSHDFWQAFLTPATWKRLHMLIYAAYVLVVFHVGLGALQAERATLPTLLMVAGVVITVGLHVLAGARETIEDLDPAGSTEDGLLDVCSYEDIPEDRAVIVCPRGRERIAVFKHAGRISAVTNVCAHQGGPLGEGSVIDGCITCPWHGWQYRPQDGHSPPPFEEKIATYQVTLRGNRVLVDPLPRDVDRPAEPAALSPSPPTVVVSDPTPRSEGGGS